MLDGGGARGGCFHDTFGPEQRGLARIIKAKELQAKSLTVGPRFGGDDAGSVWAAKPWRFIFEP